MNHMLTNQSAASLERAVPAITTLHLQIKACNKENVLHASKTCWFAGWNWHKLADESQSVIAEGVLHGQNSSILPVNIKNATWFRAKICLSQLPRMVSDRWTYPEFPLTLSSKSCASINLAIVAALRLKMATAIFCEILTLLRYLWHTQITYFKFLWCLTELSFWARVRRYQQHAIHFFCLILSTSVAVTTFSMNHSNDR